MATAEGTQDKWFAVRCVFGGVPSVPGGTRTYEERITLWRSTDMDAAIELAEVEAVEYAGDVGVDYLGMAQCYHLFDTPGHGAEIFSLMRDSPLAPEPYLDHFFDSGSERQRH